MDSGRQFDHNEQTRGRHRPSKDVTGSHRVVMVVAVAV